MRLFVQSCGDEVQFKRFEKTILQRVKIETLKGHPLFAHVTLTRSERSPIAALVTEMLEGPGPV